MRCDVCDAPPFTGECGVSPSSSPSSPSSCTSPPLLVDIPSAISRTTGRLKILENMAQFKTCAKKASCQHEQLGCEQQTNRSSGACQGVEEGLGELGPCRWREARMPSRWSGSGRPAADCSPSRAAPPAARSPPPAGPSACTPTHQPKRWSSIVSLHENATHHPHAPSKIRALLFITSSRSAMFQVGNQESVQWTSS